MCATEISCALVCTHGKKLFLVGTAFSLHSRAPPPRLWHGKTLCTCVHARSLVAGLWHGSCLVCKTVQPMGQKKRPTGCPMHPADRSWLRPRPVHRPFVGRPVFRVNRVRPVPTVDVIGPRGTDVIGVFGE